MKLAMTVGLLCAGCVVGAPAWASEALARANGCLACHDAAKRTVGPSIKDMAAKHKGKAGAAETIAANIRAGKGHPPSLASEADLKAIVGWMLK